MEEDGGRYEEDKEESEMEFLCWAKRNWKQSNQNRKKIDKDKKNCDEIDKSRDKKAKTVLKKKEK